MIKSMAKEKTTITVERHKVDEAQHPTGAASDIRPPSTSPSTA